MNDFITGFVAGVFDWLSYADELTEDDLGERADKLERAMRRSSDYRSRPLAFRRMWGELDQLHTIIANNEPEAYRVLDWFYPFLYALKIYPITKKRNISRQIGLTSLIIEQVMQKHCRAYIPDITARELMRVIAKALIDEQDARIYLAQAQEGYSIDSLLDYMECPYRYYLQYEAQIRLIEDEVNKVVETAVRNKLYDVEVHQNSTYVAYFSSNQHRESDERIRLCMAALTMMEGSIGNSRIKRRLQCQIGAYTVYGDVDIDYNADSKCMTLITPFYEPKHEMLMKFVVKCLSDELEKRVRIARIVDIAQTYKEWSLIEYVINGRGRNNAEKKLNQAIVQIEQLDFAPTPEKIRCNQCGFKSLCPEKA